MKRTGYFRKGFSSLKFEREVHNYEKLIADGWVEYDPEAPPDQSCFDTLATHRNIPCIHGYSWQCPFVVATVRTRQRAAGATP
jgi:hypothetical protein